MGQIHVLQRRVEVAQQGLALFEEEARGTGARLSEAFGRIEEVLRDKDFQLVRHQMEVQRLTRENAQAKMLLETLLETLEQRRPPALKEIIEEFERKLAASAALKGGSEPPADPGPGEADGEAPSLPSVSAGADEAGASNGAETEGAPQPQPAPLQPAAHVAAPSVGAALPDAAAPASAPIAAFADPAGDVAIAVPAAVAPAPEAPNAQADLRPAEPDDVVAGARASLRSRGRATATRLMDEEQRRYAYKVWLGPIMIGVGCLGPLALVLARIAH